MKKAVICHMPAKIIPHDRMPDECRMLGEKFKHGEISGADYLNEMEKLGEICAVSEFRERAEAAMLGTSTLEEEHIPFDDRDAKWVNLFLSWGMPEESTKKILGVSDQLFNFVKEIA